MKYYSNDIYPIALVLSYDVESVNKEYNFADGNPIEHKLTSQATTYPVTRKNVDYFAAAVAIIFNQDISTKLIAHEAFHATYMMMDWFLHIPLTDSSDEAWAYLIGWIAECIEDFKNNH